MRPNGDSLALNLLSHLLVDEVGDGQTGSIGLTDTTVLVKNGCSHHSLDHKTSIDVFYADVSDSAVLAATL